MKWIIRKISSLWKPARADVEQIAPGSAKLNPPKNTKDNVVTCFFTGKADNVCMYPLKDLDDQLVGFLFVDPEKHFSELRVNWTYKDKDTRSVLNVKTYA